MQAVRIAGGLVEQPGSSPSVVWSRARCPSTARDRLRRGSPGPLGPQRPGAVPSLPLPCRTSAADRRDLGLEPGEDVLPGAVPLPALEQVVHPVPRAVPRRHIPPRPAQAFVQGCGRRVGGQDVEVPQVPGHSRARSRSKTTKEAELERRRPAGARLGKPSARNRRSRRGRRRTGQATAPTPCTSAGPRPVRHASPGNRDRRRPASTPPSPVELSAPLGPCGDKRREIPVRRAFCQRSCMSSWAAARPSEASPCPPTLSS